MAENSDLVFLGELYRIDPTDAGQIKWALTSYAAKVGAKPSILLVHPDVPVDQIVFPEGTTLEVLQRKYVHNPSVVLMGNWEQRS